jgi:hypothetical protein
MITVVSSFSGHRRRDETRTDHSSWSVVAFEIVGLSYFCAVELVALIVLGFMSPLRLWSMILSVLSTIAKRAISRFYILEFLLKQSNF